MSKLIKKKPKSTDANPLKYDPSQTGPIRRQFMQMIEAKFRELRSRVYRKLVNGNYTLLANERITDPGEAVIDCNWPWRNVPDGPFIQLSTITKNSEFYGWDYEVIVHGPITNAPFEFPQSEGYLQQFKNWLWTQLAELFYPSAEDSWWKEYILKGWQLGAGRAYAAWTNKTDFLRSSFTQPVAVNKVKLLAGRVLSELEGVTQDMATKMSRELVDGMIQGKSPREVARAMSTAVESVSKQRALTIARTETVRAHAEGQLDTLQSLGMQHVGVAVEWSTSGMGVTRKGNPSPCELCAPMKGVVFTLEEAQGMIPRHPNCMCSFVPANVGEDVQGQTRGYKAINAALAKSVKAEQPKSTKSKNAKAKASRWQGATKRIGKSRPTSIFNKRGK